MGMSGAGDGVGSRRGELGSTGCSECGSDYLSYSPMRFGLNAVIDRNRMTLMSVGRTLAGACVRALGRRDRFA